MNYLDQIEGPQDISGLTIEEMERLAEEIRGEIISSVSRTGGHLASSLGTVELTLAWHHVFSSPEDTLIWDVGHQSYAHKIVTGRRRDFCTLRQTDGLSGFPKRCESVHDHFETGHSATSISAAVGMAEAARLAGRRTNTTAIIGDGALTGGMAFEAINHAGHMSSDVLVILNDNEMSIGDNVGALSRYLDRIRTDSFYRNTKRGLSNGFERIPLIGPSLRKGLERAKDALKYFFIAGVLFEELGFTYLGPVDGHNLNHLVEHLKRIRSLQGPVLLHAITRKGAGYTPAMDNPERFHGVGPFTVSDGTPVGRNAGQTYTQCFSQELVELGSRDERVVAITAAMAAGTGLDRFRDAYPDRFFDVAIAEQHAVTFAAGLAAAGHKPFVAIYATFMQRAIDQVTHDVCMQNLPVVFCTDRAGLVGRDGETHQGIMDLGMFKTIPNLEILFPADAQDMSVMMQQALEATGPVMIRYPRDTIDPVLHPDKTVEGDFTWIQKEGEVLIVSAGHAMRACLSAMHMLRREGIRVALVGIRRVKPFPADAFTRLAGRYGAVLVVEENCLENGIGTSVLQALDCALPVRRLALPDAFIEHGSQQDLRRRYGIDDAHIVQACRDMKQALTQ